LSRPKQNLLFSSTGKKKATGEGGVLCGTHSPYQTFTQGGGSWVKKQKKHLIRVGGEFNRTGKGGSRGNQKERQGYQTNQCQPQPVQRVKTAQNVKRNCSAKKTQEQDVGLSERRGGGGKEKKDAGDAQCGKKLLKRGPYGGPGPLTKGYGADSWKKVEGREFPGKLTKKESCSRGLNHPPKPKEEKSEDFEGGTEASLGCSDWGGKKDPGVRGRGQNPKCQPWVQMGVSPLTSLGHPYPQVVRRGDLKRGRVLHYRR